MAKKIKQIKRIPLSALDKTVYASLCIMGIACVGVIPLLFAWIAERIACASLEAVLYCNHYGILYALPLGAVIGFSLVIPSSLALDARQPLFGNKRFKAKLFQSYLPGYPFFSRSFREHLNIKEKQKFKLFVLIVAVSLLLSCVISLFGIYPRVIFDRSRCFTEYDFLNQVTFTDSAENADRLLINISRSSRHFRYNVQLGFVYGDETYYLNFDSFDDMSRESALREMLSLKALFADGRYQITNEKRIENLAYYEDLTAAELALVHELFDF